MTNNQNENMHSRSKIVLGKGLDTLQNKTIAIIGLGGTGCIVALLLARMAPKKLVIMDRDVVEATNLERQIIYNKEDVGKGKVEAASQKLSEWCAVESHFTDLMPRTIPLLDHADLIIECTDNNETRLLINDYCKKNKKQWIANGAIGQKGFVCSFQPDQPCFQCISP